MRWQPITPLGGGRRVNGKVAGRSVGKVGKERGDTKYLFSLL